MKAKMIIGLASIILFAACKGKTHGAYEVVNSGSAADSAKIDSLSLTTSKLIKKASLNFKVKNVEQTGKAINKLVIQNKGMVMHYHVGANTERSEDIKLSDDSILRVSSMNVNADMEVKVPKDSLIEFIDKVTALSVYVNNRTMDVTYKTLTYMEAQLKLKSRVELVAQQKTGKVIIKDPTNVLALKDEMVEQQINNRTIEDEVNYSTVSLSFFQSNKINKEVIANDDPATYHLSFFNQFALAFENGWRLLINLFLGTVNLWAIILLGIGLATGFVYLKRKYLNDK